MSAFVYRVWDYGGTLLYVGSSVDVDARLRHHEAHAAWWPWKDHVTREWFESAREARAAESAAIATEHPRWNVVDRSSEHPDGPISRAYGVMSSHLRDEVLLWREWREAREQLQRAELAMYRLQHRVQEIAMWRSPTLPPRLRKEESLRQLRKDSA